MNISVNHDCIVGIGRNNYFNGRLNIIVSEQSNVIIGEQSLFSFGIWIRTADPHLIYAADSHCRINHSKDVIIGDHIWVGQNALILKGTYVGSGSIIGAASVASGKLIPSNVSYAGNPAKVVRREIFWEGSCVHAWTSKETLEHEKYESNEWLYGVDKNSKTREDIKTLFHSQKSVKDKLESLILLYSGQLEKNRFAVERALIK